MNQYQDKKVLILGLGLNQGGVGSAKFFAQLGAKVKVTDIKSKEELQPSLDQLKEFPNIEYVLGEHHYEDMDWADLIIRNPSLKPENPYRIYAEKSDKRVEMDLGILLEFISPSQIIGITGTKGKSTTASLIYEALKAGGKDVVFAGNIGKSVLDTIPFVKENTLVVLELSSFQLEAFDQHQISPKWAVITNIYPDHLNYYKTMEEYIAAKRVIARYQKPEDFLFIKANDEAVDNTEFLQGLPGKIIKFSASDLPTDFQPKLPGEHNLSNMAAALAVSQAITPASQGQALPADRQVLEAMKNFQGVEFRLQLIYHKRDLKIYNDSAATNPDSTIQALKSLPNSILITGGVNKNLPYEGLAQAINKYAKAVYFLEGTATDEILRMLKSIGHQSADQNMGIYNNLERLLRDAKDILKHGDVILFSPGAASFNLFQNEFDRGRKFNEAVKSIFP